MICWMIYICFFIPFIFGALINFVDTQSRNNYTMIEQKLVSKKISQEK